MGVEAGAGKGGEVGCEVTRRGSKLGQGWGETTGANGGHTDRGDGRAGTVQRPGIGHWREHYERQNQAQL